MSDNNYEYSILSDEKDFIEYEKGLYKAFFEKDRNGWVVNHYNIIDNCRLKHKTIHYSDQKIYSIKKEKKIIGAIAINLNSNQKLQLEEMGFFLNPIDKAKKFCEGINTHFNESLGENFLDVFLKFGKFMAEDLKKNNFALIFGTCSRHTKAMHTLAGFKVIDNHEVDGIKKYLLRYDIENDLELE